MKAEPRLRPTLLVDAARAAIELGIARLRLNHQLPSKLIDTDPSAEAALDSAAAAMVESVAYIIPRVAVRLPWRADCLVQAIAAKRWLKTSGIGSIIHFGVPRESQRDFEAHAWLTVGEHVVTGGDISGYTPLRR